MTDDGANVDGGTGRKGRRRDEKNKPSQDENMVWFDNKLTQFSDEFDRCKRYFSLVKGNIELVECYQLL